MEAPHLSTAPTTEPDWPSEPRRGGGLKRALAWGGLALALAGAGYGGWVWSSRQAPVKYVTVAIDRGDIVAKVTASGTLAASRTVEVGSQISGRIQQLYVDFNSPVRKGQVLARIDPQLLVAAKQQAVANQAAARAALRRAHAQAGVAVREAGRAGSLARQGFIAAADLDTSRTNAEVARAQIVSAEAALAQADAAARQAAANLGYAAIVSPIDGVVITRNVSVGQTVAASLQAPTLFVLAEDLRRLEVQANVAEADVGRLRPGMKAGFTVDAYPGEPFTGTIRQIRNAPQTVQNVVTYLSILEVANPDGRLRIGMTANVGFVEEAAEDVLRVPNAALRYRPSEAAFPRGERRWGGTAGREGEPQRAGEATPGPEAGAEGEGQRRWRGPRVWVLDGERIRPVRVETGLTDGAYTEVEDGDLAEGDQVITDELGAGASPRPNGGGARNRRSPRMF